jgi:hypothetical protein
MSTSELLLVKPSWKHLEYALQTPDGTQVAWLDYSFAGTVTVTTADGGWKVSRPRGLSARKMPITDLATGAEVGLARLHAWSRKATVQLQDAAYEISCRGWLGNRWVVANGTREVLQFQSSASLGENKGRLVLSGEDPALLLAAIAVHVMVTESAAASAASG